MSDIEFAQRQAQIDHERRVAQMATEQQIRDAAVREAHNAAVEFHRRADEERRRATS